MVGIGPRKLRSRGGVGLRNCSIESRIIGNGISRQIDGQMNAMRADIIYVENGASGNLLLYAKIPFLSIRKGAGLRETRHSQSGSADLMAN